MSIAVNIRHTVICDSCTTALGTSHSGWIDAAEALEFSAALGWLVSHNGEDHGGEWCPECRYQRGI